MNVMIGKFVWHVAELYTAEKATAPVDKTLDNQVKECRPPLLSDSEKYKRQFNALWVAEMAKSDAYVRGVQRSMDSRARDVKGDIYMNQKPWETLLRNKRPIK